MPFSCGIDFGTSNSTVGIAGPNGIAMVPLEGRHVTIPSAIFHPADGAPPLYGREGIEAYTQGEAGRLLRSLKSILGSALADDTTAVGGKHRPFEDILVGFVSHLKARAEAAAGQPLSRVVMGRPVHFVDDDPAADHRAEAKLETIARKAGFTEVLFQYEPIAAALQFEDTLDREELVFIADIGGGTSDFSIVRASPRRKAVADRAADILASDGVRVGGTNLDMRLSMDAVMPLFGAGSATLEGHPIPDWPFRDLATWHRIHAIAEGRNMAVLRQILYEAEAKPLFQRYLKIVADQTGHLIAKRVEDAKIALSAATQAAIPLEVVEPGLAAAASREGFEAATQPEREKIEATIARTLAGADLAADDITAVFLTGGTSAVPAVKETLIAPFPRARVAEGDLFASVGHGLALDAKRRLA